MLSAQQTHFLERLTLLRYCACLESHIQYGYLWVYLCGLECEGRISWDVYQRLMKVVDSAYSQVEGRAHR